MIFLKKNFYQLHQTVKNKNDFLLDFYKYDSLCAASKTFFLNILIVYQ